MRYIERLMREWRKLACLLAIRRSVYQMDGFTLGYTRCFTTRVKLQATSSARKFVSLSRLQMTNSLFTYCGFAVRCLIMTFSHSVPFPVSAVQFNLSIPSFSRPAAMNLQFHEMFTLFPILTCLKTGIAALKPCR